MIKKAGACYPKQKVEFGKVGEDAGQRRDKARLSTPDPSRYIDIDIDR